MHIAPSHVNMTSTIAIAELGSIWLNACLHASPTQKKIDSPELCRVWHRGIPPADTPSPIKDASTLPQPPEMASPAPTVPTGIVKIDPTIVPREKNRAIAYANTITRATICWDRAKLTAQVTASLSAHDEICVFIISTVKPIANTQNTTVVWRMQVDAVMHVHPARQKYTKDAR